MEFLQTEKNVECEYERCNRNGQEKANKQSGIAQSDHSFEIL